eukprot:3172058-Pleurochrysis_carterae.AAC.2
MCAAAVHASIAACGTRGLALKGSSCCGVPRASACDRGADAGCGVVCALKMCLSVCACVRVRACVCVYERGCRRCITSASLLSMADYSAAAETRGCTRRRASPVSYTHLRAHETDSYL